MKNDILPPPKRPTAPSETPVVQLPPVVPPSGEPIRVADPSPVTQDGSSQESVPPQANTDSPKNNRKLLLNMLAVFTGLVLIAAMLVGWYLLMLQPATSEPADKVRITIAENSSLSQIGQLLEDQKIIRSGAAFAIHSRVNGVSDKLQAGVFSLSPNESTPVITGHLLAGSSDQYAVTFYPGATLNIASSTTDQTPSHRQVLERLNFSKEEIDEAFAASYDHPLLAEKPASADLEGYIYGETYMVASGASVKQVLSRTFDEYYARLQEHGVISGFKEQGLTLHEGITLASIVQREVSNAADQRQVAQVFYRRLATDMPLGADATFVYAAGKMGVQPSVDLDSPYNTRKYGGLPPGPISSPGVGALRAVAAPADGDYLYFVSGDDGTNYFSRTLEEHEAKTKQYCQANCRLF